MNSLREMLRQRFHTSLEQLPDKYLVVDSTTIKIISGLFSVTDIINAKVFNIELLENKRQPFPYDLGLYFITPCMKSIDLLNMDFRDPTLKQYSRIYIYFSSPISDQLIKKISTKTAKCVIEIVDYNLEVFLSRDSFQDDNMFSVRDDVGLFTLCASLGTAPLMVCDDTTAGIKRKVEGYLQEMDFHNTINTVLFIVNNPVYHTSAAGNSYIARLHHSGLVVDGKYIYHYVDNKNENRTSDIIFNDDDELWVKYRYMDLDQVSVIFKEDYEKFYQENSLFIRGGDSIKEMGEIIHGIQEFQYKSLIFACHRKLIDTLLGSYDKREESKNVPLKDMILESRECEILIRDSIKSNNIESKSTPRSMRTRKIRGFRAPSKAKCRVRPIVILFVNDMNISYHEISQLRSIPQYNIMIGAKRDIPQ